MDDNNSINFQELIFRLMDKQDSCDAIIRDISVQTESNTQKIEGITSKCLILHNMENGEDNSISPKKAVKMFRGMSGWQRFLLLLVWGVVTALGLLIFILINLDKINF